MSRVHLHFIKEKQDDRNIVYRVVSSDFSLKHEEEPIARITIDREERTYSFDPLGELAMAKVVPPDVFDLSQCERDQALKEKYQGFGYGGWTARMATVVRRMLEKGVFPDETYGVS